MTDAEIDHVFSHQQPDVRRIPNFVAVREAAIAFAKSINANAPNPNSEAALTAKATARAALLWAIAAIACDSTPQS